ncbi:zinc-dependent metalloprotease [Dolichospermum sp. UHCC 0684]|uniref:zinc-dependent metalloprotease n=1 Tax=unclassified Dolichospermum TaxID=2622029 RepID=UPI001447D29A|nr:MULTISPECIES: zinc-dependent metalloprotease [unclassified Dolichospermum]MEA5530789.1 zinc-dependent metalloprotease [Dolichospermum sp. UHCC 0684]MTJ36687.1 zinc-dependent metalloprotease [Dolichospermum sp. UHCC 0260]MTJ39651.1 zinc-dependent metalloprotease [Dolichospermum sp. UHCC 0406]
MNKFTFALILFNSLFVSIETADAKSLINNHDNSNIEIERQTTNVDKIVQQLKLPSSKIAVIDQNHQVKIQNFVWVFKDLKEVGKQPFLQVKKETEKPKTKPESNSKSPKEDELEDFTEVTKDTQKSEGIFTIYRHKHKNKIYLEIKPEQLQKNFIANSTLESGIGEKGIYSGMPLQDFLFYFQKVDNQIQFVVRNVNFRTREGDPQARSVARSFSDSVLYTIPIKSINSQGKTILIDLGDLLLTDLAGLSTNLELAVSPDQGYLGNAKVFPNNLEIGTIFNFANGGKNSDVLPDSRGFTLKVHYSLSELPKTKYQPRLADERVGYFLTAYQDLSKDERRDTFVRYINRWNLEKQDPTAAISPPKKPIVFWIDNAVPLEYRQSIKEGILMWNQAFLKAGFKDAIQVQQMPDNATWDPADIRYNTIRWINTVDGFFAMGPSRVNPLTGEILNADILIDGSFVRLLKNDYRQIIQPQNSQTSTSLSTLVNNGRLCGKGNQKSPKSLGNLSKLATDYDLCYGMEASNQLAFGSLAMSMLGNTTPSPEQLKDYIHQYLRLIITHEVGHTLGLRHNFRGSTLLFPEEMNNPEITQTKGMTASVMDYIPPNIAPNGVKQGDYFPQQVGPYDEWVIEYGYTPSQASTTMGEKSFLAAIAGKSNQRELSYAPDEDLSNSDPTVNPWDHSSNVLVYSHSQLANARRMWERLNQGYAIDAENSSDVEERFNTILRNYLQNLYYTSKYIGGQSFYRVKPNDTKGQLPFVPVPVEQQRQALMTMQKYVFAEDALKFPPELLNKLVPSRWLHWGTNIQIGRLDYPIHDLVLLVQTAVLRDLLASDRLTRIKDLELKSETGKSLTLPELFDTLQTGIWSEVLQPKGKLKISSLRRGLQREYLNVLMGMVLRKEATPEDARTLAWYKLKQLNNQLKRVNSEDEYTQAFLLETRDRIEKTLNAPLVGN